MVRRWRGPRSGRRARRVRRDDGLQWRADRVRGAGRAPRPSSREPLRRRASRKRTAGAPLNRATLWGGGARASRAARGVRGGGHAGSGPRIRVGERVARRESFKLVMRASTASDEAPPSGDVEVSALRAYGARAANGWRPSGVHEARLPTRVCHPLGYPMGRTHATFHLREPPLACVRFRRRLDGSRLESFRPSPILAGRAPARFSILRAADFDRISVAPPPPRGAEERSRPSAFHCSKPAVPRPHARR